MFHPVHPNNQIKYESAISTEAPENPIMRLEFEVFRRHNKDAALQYGRGLRKGLYKYSCSRLETLEHAARVLREADQSAPDVKYNLARTCHLLAGSLEGRMRLDYEHTQSIIPLYKSYTHETKGKACYRLGQIYANGDGLEYCFAYSRKVPDPFLAALYFKKATSAGHKKALQALHYQCAQTGDVITLHYKPLADKGDAEAQFQLAKWLSFSENPQPDFTLADHYLNLAIKQGHTKALYKKSIDLSIKGEGSIAMFEKTLAVGKKTLKSPQLWTCYHHLIKLYIQRSPLQGNKNGYFFQMAVKYALKGDLLTPGIKRQALAYCGKVLNDHFDTLHLKEETEKCIAWLKLAYTHYCVPIEALHSTLENLYAHLLYFKKKHFSDSDKDLSDESYIRILRENKSTVRCLKKRTADSCALYLMALHFSVNEPDQEKAFHFIHQSLEKQREMGQAPSLAYRYFGRHGDRYPLKTYLKSYPDDTCFYYETLADAGDKGAQNQLSKHYYRQNDKEKSYHYLKLAAVQNHPSALYRLAIANLNISSDEENIIALEKALQHNRLNLIRLWHIYDRLTTCYIKLSSHNHSLLQIATEYVAEKAKIENIPSAALCGETLNNHFDLIVERIGPELAHQWLKEAIFQYKTLITKLEKKDHSPDTFMYFTLLKFKQKPNPETQEYALNLLRKNYSGVSLLVKRQQDFHARLLLAHYYSERGYTQEALLHFKKMKECSGDDHLLFQTAVYIIGRIIDIEFGISILQKLASTDYLPALRLLGKIYRNGRPVDRDLYAALYYLEKTCLSPQAMDEDYLTAAEVAADIGGDLYESRCEYYLLRSVDNHSLEGHYRLALLYLRHQGSARYQDRTEEGLHLMNLAANRGYRDAEIYLNPGAHRSL